VPTPSDNGLRQQSWNCPALPSKAASGADYQLTVNDDLALEARYTLRTGDGELIAVRNCGDDANSDLTLPMFETSGTGAYAWLNDDALVGTITPGLTRVTIDVYRRR